MSSTGPADAYESSPGTGETPEPDGRRLVLDADQISRACARMAHQILEANRGAGNTDANLPRFRLYRDNLENIRKWTQERMGGRAGICVPETMRWSSPCLVNL